MQLCVFDLDHTLVRSPLDLRAMADEMRAFVERAWGALPAREERYRVFELIDHCRRHAPELEAALWAIALDHERRALADATPEPGAHDALVGTRAAGWVTALWTNNAREVTLAALERLGLALHLDLVVTRDEMRALKPDPDGWRLIAAHFGVAPSRAVVVGDSWVDGLAAKAAGLAFVAYRADARELGRWAIAPLATLDDLGALPAWLAGATPPAE